MSISESSGVQDWRAVACLAPNGERLLCVGGSSAQVRAAYAGAWGEVIRDEDRPNVRAISLQQWAGRAWSGQWEHQTYLAVPTTRNGKAVPGELEEQPDLDAELAAAPEEEIEEIVEKTEDGAGAKSKAKA